MFTRGSDDEDEEDEHFPSRGFYDDIESFEKKAQKASATIVGN